MTPQILVLSVGNSHTFLMQNYIGIPFYYPTQGGHSKKFQQRCPCYFLGLKLGRLLFFGAAQNVGYFLGGEK